MATSRLALLSQRLNSGRLGKIGQYFKNIYSDYEAVAIETWVDMKANKVKSAVYLTTLGTCGALIATNPSEVKFYQQLSENTNELLLIGDPIRNVDTDSHMQQLTRYWNECRLRRFTFGICSVMWVDNFDKCVDLYEAQCKQLKVGWLNWHEKIVDVGVAGRWRYLDRAMIDYDINPQEWNNNNNNSSNTDS